MGVSHCPRVPPGSEMLLNIENLSFPNGRRVTVPNHFLYLLCFFCYVRCNMKCSSDFVSSPLHLILEYVVEKSVVQLEQGGLNAGVSGFYLDVFSLALTKALLHIRPGN